MAWDSQAERHRVGCHSSIPEQYRDGILAECREQAGCHHGIPEQHRDSIRAGYRERDRAERL